MPSTPPLPPSTPPPAALTPADLHLWHAICRAGLGATSYSSAHDDTLYRAEVRDKLALARTAIEKARQRIAAGEENQHMFRVYLTRVMAQLGAERSEAAVFRNFVARGMREEKAREERTRPSAVGESGQ